MHSNTLPLNLQFFGEGDTAQTTGGAAGTDTTNTQADSTSGTSTETTSTQQTSTDTSQSTEKTFTQTEVTAMLSNEKHQGKNAMLNLFGLKNEKEAKTAAAAFKAWKDSQLTDEQKQQQAQDTATEADQRAQAAENKLACVIAGVNKDSLEDALAIALLKVTDDKNIDAVLTEMKAQDRYKGFFGEDTNSHGTGSDMGHRSNSSNSKENIGTRLASNVVQARTAKSSYFKTN